MNLGLSTDYFYDSSPEEAMEHFSAVGCEYAELSTEHSEELAARDDTSKTGKLFKSLADNLGITIPQGHLLISADIAGENQDKTIDILKNWLELYLYIGITSAVIHPGGRQMIKQGYEKQEINRKRAYALERLAGFVKGTPLTICLENTTGTIPFAEGLLDLIEMAGADNLGICLDTGHLHISKGNQGEFIRRAGGYLKALHIHDNEGSEDQHILPFGCGGIDWKDFLDALRSIQYDGIFNFEIPLESRAPLDIRYAKFRYIREVYNYLMKWQSGLTSWRR